MVKCSWDYEFIKLVRGCLALSILQCYIYVSSKNHNIDFFWKFINTIKKFCISWIYLALTRSTCGVYKQSKIVSPICVIALQICIHWYVFTADFYKKYDFENRLKIKNHQLIVKKLFFFSFIIDLLSKIMTELYESK